MLFSEASTPDRQLCVVVLAPSAFWPLSAVFGDDRADVNRAAELLRRLCGFYCV
jgi:hypothetical protein